MRSSTNPSSAGSSNPNYIPDRGPAPLPLSSDEIAITQQRLISISQRRIEAHTRANTSPFVNNRQQSSSNNNNNIGSVTDTRLPSFGQQQQPQKQLTIETLFSPENTGAESRAKGRWHAPELLKKIPKSVYHDSFTLLPPNFKRMFASHRQVYLDSEMLLRTLKSPSRKGLCKPVLWFMHQFYSHGLRLVTEEAMSDYILFTFNFLTLDEDDANVLPPWNDDKQMSIAQFEDEMRDYLRVNLIVTIKTDSNARNLFDPMSFDRSKVLVDNEKNAIVLEFQTAFYSLVA